MTPLTHAVTRLVLVTGALALAGVAWLEPSLRRDVDGSLLPFAWTVVTAALGLGMVAASVGTRWQRSGALFALALFGQSAALNLIDTPPYNVLQHYFPWGELVGSRRGLLLMVLLVQTIVVGIAGWSVGRNLDLRRLPGGMAGIALAVFLIVGISANGSFEPGRFLGELALSGWIVLVNLVNLALVAAAVPEAAIRSAGAAIDRSGARLPLACATWVIAVSGTIAWFVFDHTPIITDSVSYLFQARYFAAGYLYLPAPPDLQAFNLEKLYTDGIRWWAYGFPAWPAVLSLGVRLGVPWLVNPLLGGLTILMTYSLLHGVYDAPFARRAVLLLSASPWFLYMSASHMPHTVAVVWLLAALLALRRASRTHGLTWATGGGAALGALFLTRPLEAMLVAPAIGVLVLILARQGLRWSGVAAFVTGGAIVSSILFAYNEALTGDAFTTPLSVHADALWYPDADRIGFGADIGNVGWPHLDPLPGHGPADALINGHQNAVMVNADLFGWSCGSLLLVAWIMLVRGLRGADRLFFAILALIPVGHGLYWFSGGPDIGARYWYQALVPLVVLTIRGGQELASKWPAGALSATAAGTRIGAFMAVASLAALVTFVPWRASAKYHDYRGMNDDLSRLARVTNFGRSVVFVRETSSADYARAVLLNPPDLQKSRDTIYARDLGPAHRAEVLRHFPDRPFWIVQGPADPSAAFVVLEGPVQPGRGSHPPN